MPPHSRRPTSSTSEFSLAAGGPCERRLGWRGRGIGIGAAALRVEGQRYRYRVVGLLGVLTGFVFSIYLS